MEETMENASIQRMSTSKSMINELTNGLTKRHGEISLIHGPVINYLGMVLDFTRTGRPATRTTC
jgi:hypothetical protein